MSEPTAMRAAKLADGAGCNTKIRIPSMPTRYRLENWVEIFIGDKASAMSMDAQNTRKESAHPLQLEGHPISNS